MFNSLKFTVMLVLIYCSVARLHAEEKEIIIDLNKAKGAPAQEIVTSIEKENLPDSKIKLINVGSNNTKDNYEFSGDNFEIDTFVSQEAMTHNSASNQIEIPLQLLENIATPDEGFFRYKITYTGSNPPVLFSAGTEVTFELKVTGQIDTEKKTIRQFSELEIQKAAIDFVKREYEPKKYFSEKTGLYFKGNTVHIFVDENSNLIYTGIPTTAKESYIYQLHLLVSKKTDTTTTFKFTYEGKFQPQFNIDRTLDEETTLNAAELKEEKPIIVEIPYAKIGPFTDSFTIKLEKIEGSETENLIDSQIDVAKLFHVSISTGLLKTTLTNPQNIEKMPLANSTDTTLVADDPGLRGVVTIMATFYPNGRSFLFPPSGGPFSSTRLGIQVGAQLNDNLSENFFLGLSHDFARGGTISYGVHCGRRNYVAGKKDFNFGKDVFDLPELKIKKEWNVGFYFGVVIDTRVAVELIRSLGAAN